jgi:hypothetical protein
MARLKTDPDVSEPFERSLDEWHRLGAPIDVYDATAAALSESTTCASQYRISFADAWPEQKRYLLARRWWHWRRPEFLAACGALTAQEITLLQRFPKFYAKPARMYRDSARSTP